MAIILPFYFASCQKIEYEQVDNPAYLRVFNAVWDMASLEQEGQEAFLCMLIDPQFDSEGIPTGAGIVGDFLDKRADYAYPYPTGIGTGTSTSNTDWPGSNVIPVGPVVNGFDLSSWAQVSSGEHRIVFMYRPKNETPFFFLDREYRADILVDTLITLQEGEVYTMNALTLDFATKRKGIVLRRENFLKQAFSDERVYVNFYNYNARGFAEAPDGEKKSNERNYTGLFDMGIKDTMDIYYSLFTGREYGLYSPSIGISSGIVFLPQVRNPANSLVYTIPDGDPGYDREYMTTLRHTNFSSEPAPYHSFPLWLATDTTGKIYTDLWQRFFFLKPGLDIKNLPSDYSEASTASTGLYSNPQGNYAILTCFMYNIPFRFHFGQSGGATSGSVFLPNMVVTIPSGTYTQRSFATVNSVEVINNKVYLTTIQRKFDPPVYQ